MLQLVLMIFIFIILGFACLSWLWAPFIITSKFGPRSVFGKMGSGKSTDIAREIYKAQGKGWSIFTNFEYPSATLIDPHEIGHRFFPKFSLILIDEAGLIWFNRNYKDLDDEFIEYLRMARKLKNRIIFYSQTADVDKKIRDLSLGVYIIKKHWLFAVKRAINKELSITSSGPDTSNASGTSDIGDKLSYIPWFVPGAITIFFIPRYAWLFDSDELYSQKEYFEVNPLPYDPAVFTRKWYTKTRNKFILGRFKSVCMSIKKFFKKLSRGAKKRSKLISDWWEDSHE